MIRYFLFVFILGILVVVACYVLYGQQVPTAGSAVYSGSLAVTTTAQALPNHAVRQVCIETLASVVAYVGPSGVTTANGYELDGTSICLNVNNTAAVSIIAGGNVAATWVATTN